MRLSLSSLLLAFDLRIGRDDDTDTVSAVAGSPWPADATIAPTFDALAQAGERPKEQPVSVTPGSVTMKLHLDASEFHRELRRSIDRIDYRSRCLRVSAMTEPLGSLRNIGPIGSGSV